jgi:hypothetical protein
VGTLRMPIRIHFIVMCIVICTVGDIAFHSHKWTCCRQGCGRIEDVAGGCGASLCGELRVSWLGPGPYCSLWLWGWDT